MYSPFQAQLHHPRIADVYVVSHKSAHVAVSTRNAQLTLAPHRLQLMLAGPQRVNGVL